MITSTSTRVDLQREKMFEQLQPKLDADTWSRLYPIDADLEQNRLNDRCSMVSFAKIPVIDDVGRCRSCEIRE